MNLLQSFRNKFSNKKPCYECGKPSSRVHTVHYNFHGTLSHHEVCDACYQKLKGKAAPAARH